MSRKPDHGLDLLEAMQAVALDAYADDGAPVEFAGELYRVVFCEADPVIGDTLVTPPVTARIRHLAEQSQTWWERGTALPELIPLSLARMRYEHGLDMTPGEVRAKLLALADQHPEHAEWLHVAECMIRRFTCSGVVRTEEGLRLGYDL